MPNFICTSCGTQYADSDQPPAACTICQDERQYVKATGQQWTTLDKLRLTNRNSLKFKEPGLIGVGLEPHFAIGQRALFLRTPKANVLWDCLPLLDPAVVEAIKALGGISAIAVSHPHYYSSMAEWSRAFGGVPIYLHAADRQWIMRPDKAIVFWEGCGPTTHRGAFSDSASRSFCRLGPTAHRAVPTRRRMLLVALGLLCLRAPPADGVGEPMLEAPRKNLHIAGRNACTAG